MRDSQEGRFIERAADQLQSYRQAFVREAARNRNGRMPCKIRRAADSDERRAYPNFFAVDFDGFRANRGRGKGNGGHGNGVHLSKRGVKFGAQDFLHLERRQITDSRHISARDDSMEHIFAVFLGPLGEIPGFILNITRFGK